MPSRTKHCCPHASVKPVSSSPLHTQELALCMQLVHGACTGLGAGPQPGTRALDRPGWQQKSQQMLAAANHASAVCH